MPWVPLADILQELIKYKGLQVAPAELEALLLSHPLILDAAVIGVEQDSTEVPRAYVVPARDPKTMKPKITEEEIKAFVMLKASSHKQLRGGVVMIDVVPKSAAGKILRRELRELVKKERQSGLKAQL